MPDSRVATTPDPEATQSGLEALNALSTDHAQRAFAECCAAERWASEMARSRPYASLQALLDHADTTFEDLAPEDWMQAFSAHARIGAPKPGDARGRAEQSGASTATPEQIGALLQGNEEYEAKFGHVFLIRAKGRDAAAMLEALRERLLNSPERELEIAAAQQREITYLRLDDLLSDTRP